MKIDTGSLLIMGVLTFDVVILIFNGGYWVNKILAAIEKKSTIEKKSK